MSTPIYHADIEAAVSFWGQDQTLAKSGTGVNGIGVTSHLGTYTFNGAKTSSTTQAWRCKLDGTMERTTSSSTVTGWTRTIALTGGHTYRISVQHVSGSVTIGSHKDRKNTSELQSRI